MNTAENLTIDLFISRVKELSDCLYFLSESEYPLEPLQFTTASTALTEPDICELAGKPPGSKIEIVELNYFFRNMTTDPAEADEDYKIMTRRFRELITYLEEHLQELKVYRVGQVEVLALILGKLNDKQFAGLKTTVVET